MHCDLSGFGGTHSYCNQWIGEEPSGERMALLGVPGSRFAEPVSDNDEVALHESAIPRNTKATTEWGIPVWLEWSAQRATFFPANGLGIVSVTTPLLGMPTADLSYWMGKFWLQVCKKDGSKYQPKSLYALVCCFKCFYKQNGIQNGIHGSNTFNHS